VTSTLSAVCRPSDRQPHAEPGMSRVCSAGIRPWATTHWGSRRHRRRLRDTCTYRIRSTDIRYPHSLTDTRIGHWARAAKDGRPVPVSRHARSPHWSLDPDDTQNWCARSRRHRFEPGGSGTASAADLPNNSTGWVPREALGDLVTVNTHAYVAKKSRLRSSEAGPPSSGRSSVSGVPTGPRRAASSTSATSSRTSTPPPTDRSRSARVRAPTG
jgi:hypothetical protein